MVQVKADDAVLAILGPLRERAEILDDRGMLVGYFEPVEKEEDALYRKATSLFDPEDVRSSLLIDGPWKTTEEVLDRLRPDGTV